MDSNRLISIIKNRRSIRKYTDKDISIDIINQILESGRWAPSGLNNQPWRFSVIKDISIKNELSKLTKYHRIIETSNTCIAVFYNVGTGYNRDKDLMSIGACVQNMLLTADSLNLGGVWLGEILNKKDDVNKLLDIDSENELVAVIALGYPDESPQKDRKDMNSLVIKNFL